MQNEELEGFEDSMSQDLDPMEVQAIAMSSPDQAERNQQRRSRDSGRQHSPNTIARDLFTGN